MALANLSIYYILKNIKSKCNNKKFKISASMIHLIYLMVLILLLITDY